MVLEQLDIDIVLESGEMERLPKKLPCDLIPIEGCKTCRVQFEKILEGFKAREGEREVIDNSNTDGRNGTKEELKPGGNVKRGEWRTEKGYGGRKRVGA